jgi:hypothetical protein
VPVFGAREHREGAPLHRVGGDTPFHLALSASANTLGSVACDQAGSHCKTIDVEKSSAGKEQCNQSQTRTDEHGSG